jgi:ubiquinone/menaquinone biosynthesis C-methylase UbiE
MADPQEPGSADTESTEGDRIREFFDRRGAVQTWQRGRDYLTAERHTLLGHVADGMGKQFSAISVLDVGCGNGTDLAYWRDAGVPATSLAGTELIPERAAAARRLLPGASIVDAQDVDLPFPDEKFDVTSASLVFSLIRNEAMRIRLFDEMWRVTRQEGRVVVYDFVVRRPTNNSVTAMTARRISALGRTPSERISAGPFLPLLPTALRLPSPLRSPVLRLLPRTHAFHVWERI